MNDDDTSLSQGGADENDGEGLEGNDLDGFEAAGAAWANPLLDA